MLLEYITEKLTNLEDDPKVFRLLCANLITPVNRTQTQISMSGSAVDLNEQNKKSIFKWSFKDQKDELNLQRKREMLL